MVIPSHMNWLSDTGERVKTKCGRDVEIWSFNAEGDQAALSAWAAHFRHHYIADADLPKMVAGTGLSKAEYLTQILFPDENNPPGPSLRAGDFGEILVADYAEYVLNYWCPRELRYQDRWNRNDSTKGCDVIGFKFANEDQESPNDELFVFESKAGMTKTGANRLQNAIDDSIKDKLREPMSLNAIKRRFYDRGAVAEAKRVQRFQNQAGNPFKRINGAAAILDSGVFSESDISAANASAHPNAINLRLVVFRGPSLMQLIHALYERAAIEA